MNLDAVFNMFIRHAGKVLLLAGLLCLGLGWQIQHFRLDASADSLVVEGDPDLEFSRQVNARYGTGDFVFVVYDPEMALFSTPVLEQLRALRAELLALPRVASVDSIFSVPLFDVANASLVDVADNIITLDSAEEPLDLEAVRADLSSNEAYRNVLLSADGDTTALVVNFAPDTALQDALKRRDELRTTQGAGTVNGEQLAAAEAEYLTRKTAADRNLHADITAIRAILERYRGEADVVMGGVPMIADDLTTFVSKDLQTFGVAILVFIIAALAWLFGQWRFVLIPLLCGLTLTVCMLGLLGALNWPVTVISSNFVSLLLIITVSLTVHLIVRYRELAAERSDLTHVPRLRQTLRDMVLPCAYTSLTTIVAFASLLTSDIPPIIDFGWMMVVGITLAFCFSFILFPAAMRLLPPRELPPRQHGLDITPALGRFTDRHGMLILITALVMLVACVLGIQRLRVENSFIDYFDESTDIYQGMVTIDEKMGGTTPLDLVLDMRRPNPFGDDDPFADEGGFDDEFAWDDEDPASAEAYWFTSDKMARIVAIHDWLDALPETGKVLSLGTLLKLAYDLNDGRTLSSLELGVLYNRIPPEYKESLLQPYVAVADDQVRFSIRVRETDPTLVRGALLQQIREGMIQEFDFAPEQVHLTGMLVLYNNMLLSLFESQILTLSLVMAVVFLMFLVLFRSLWLAVLGIIPNLLAALAVLGLMGWLGIPLDMMTITIAAISVGIGVDNTIHYIHRFRTHYPASGNYRATMHYCHGSIGKAMYYTSFTIVAGFSILMLSNFVPTVYFGLLTSLAMLLALVGSLTLLPQLLIICKPLGPETSAR